MRRGDGHNVERIIAIGSPLLLLLAWQVFSDAGLVDDRFIPSPAQIFKAAVAMARTGELWSDIGVSLYRLLAGMIIGGAPGLAVGMIMGLNRYIRAALDPLIAALYPIPKIAILPLLMLAFGLGDASKIAAVAISIFLLTAINTMAGVLAIDKGYFDVAANFKTPWPKLFTRVILPATLPTIFSGLRIGLGLALVVLVAAEFVSSHAGIGYLIWSSWETLLIDRMFVGIIAITILGVLANVLLNELASYFVPWKKL